MLIAVILTKTCLFVVPSFQTVIKEPLTSTRASTATAETGREVGREAILTKERGKLVHS
jgi:hypothetical protein